MKRFFTKRIRLIEKSITHTAKRLTQNRAIQIMSTVSAVPYIIWQLLMPVIPLGKMADNLSNLSRFVLEKQKTRYVVGFNLASFLLIFSLIPFTHIQANSFPAVEEIVLSSPELSIDTEETFQMPVPGYISQNYGWLHHGIDIAGNNGVPVYPITNGTVKEIAYSRLGYGLQVIVDHGNGIISRYAHLQANSVELNQKLTKKDVLGYVGSTGWSTGPHLHLEVYQNDRSINPFAYVPTDYSKDIKVVASEKAKLASSKDQLKDVQFASVSAQLEFKEIVPGFVDPNWYSGSTATPSASAAF